MPSIRKRVAVPLGGANVFPLVGDQYEYLPFDARVQFAMCSIGAANTNTLATVYSGSDVLQQSGPISIKTPANPVFPDDFLLDDVAAQGERISVILSNIGTANDTVDVAVIITPV